MLKNELSTKLKMKNIKAAENLSAFFIIWDQVIIFKAPDNIILISKYQGVFWDVLYDTETFLIQWNNQICKINK